MVWALREPSTLATAGGVVIRSSLASLPISLGDDAAAAGGIELSNAELAQIQTTATGTLTIGDSAQTGNITFSTATPATTAVASTVVVQKPNGPGEIILDDDAGLGTGLDGNGGSIGLTAGTGGIVAASSNDGAAEIATTGATVTLDTSGPIGTSSNRIQFADNANSAEQNVIIGSNIQPSSVYLDGLGSLTLGDIEGGTANTQIDVTARTNLAVAAGATIDSGTGTLSSGRRPECGRHGQSPAWARSRLTRGPRSLRPIPRPSAITLRGAEINIDTSANPAVVGASDSARHA